MIYAIATMLAIMFFVVILLAAQVGDLQRKNTESLSSVADIFSVLTATVHLVSAEQASLRGTVGELADVSNATVDELNQIKYALHALGGVHLKA